MKKHASVVALLALMAAPLLAQPSDHADKKMMPGMKDGMKDGMKMPAGMEKMMDPKAMEAAMMEAGKVGPMHAWMKGMEGDWAAECKEMDMTKPGEWKTSKGMMTNKMTMDGRFMEGTFKGSMDGKDYVGQSCMGYNNTSKMFESTWHDSMNTGMTMMKGTADSAGKVLTMSGECACPIGGQMNMRMVTTMMSRDAFKQEFFMTMAGMPEMKGMEINYTRSNSAVRPDGTNPSGEMGEKHEMKKAH
ncbi:hypothetical protein BH11PLA1_BH11PLA1_14200 [soil metagenome]